MPLHQPFPVKSAMRELGIYNYRFTAAATPAEISGGDPAGLITLSDDGAGTYGLTVKGFPHKILAGWCNLRSPADPKDMAFVDSVNLTTGKIVVKTLDDSAGAVADLVNVVVDVFIVMGTTGAV